MQFRQILSRAREAISYHTPPSRADFLKQEAAKAPRTLPNPAASLEMSSTKTDSPAPSTPPRETGDSNQTAELPVDVSDRHEPQPTRDPFNPDTSSNGIALMPKPPARPYFNPVQSLMDAAKPHAS